MRQSATQDAQPPGAAAYLFLIGKRLPDVLPNRQRVNLLREVVPAFRSLEHSPDNVQFPVERRIRSSRCIAFSNVARQPAAAVIRQTAMSPRLC